MRTISWAAMLLFATVLSGECARAQSQNQSQSQGQGQGQGQERSQEQEVAVRASVTATYSDNPARAPTTGQSATALDGLVGLTIAHQSPLLYVDADMAELQRAYVQGHLPSESIPHGYLNLLAGPPGGLLTWTVMDSFGQISSEPFAALVAHDRQNINVLSTGPNLRLPLDSHDHFDLEGRYGLDSFSDTTLNDRSYNGQAAFTHDIASASQVGLVYSYQRIDFRNSALNAAEIQEAYAKYSLAGARTYVVLEAGVDQLSQGAITRQHIAHVLALLQRHLTERLTFEAAYRNGYTHTGTEFVAASRDGFTTGTDQNVQGLAQPYKESEGYAKLVRDVGRLLGAIEVSASEETYLSQPVFDRRVVSSNLEGDYRLSSTFYLNFRAGYWRERFPNTGAEGSSVDAWVGLSHKLGRSLLLSLLAEHTKGSGSAFNGGFKENRAVLALAWAPGAQRLQRIYDPGAPFRFYDRPVLPPH
jgi:hypothetical protein